MQVKLLNSVDEIDSNELNALPANDYPFLRAEFLQALEHSGSVGGNSGWQVCHFALLAEDGELLAFMPCYLKWHSYGEYVFDHAWADAYERSGLAYYPKLLTAVPFTPSTGPRLRLATTVSEQDALQHFTQTMEQLAFQISDESVRPSSWHYLFAQNRPASELALLHRSSIQFHWFNRSYDNFDSFLGQLKSRNRKAIRKARQRVSDQGVSCRMVKGTDLSAADWDQFTRFYQSTYRKRSGHNGYLNGAFFRSVGESLAPQIHMAQAFRDGEWIAAAWFMQDSTTLYGRYWGCSEDVDELHFELCYYQAIEFAIANGLQRIDAGAQGVHKLKRGFEPVLTDSYHAIYQPEFKAAIADFLQREALDINSEFQACSEYLPYRTES
ncbi:GNAT family N-acetyltransferase [uncultured Umboniibacter sp.]|uniref:GNAT family N-acetyltransferase n=1 Tax=uncultured Umboniibacter sp. TaxID=1798917 RepID=UPI00262B6405|nr:GNAT family N-acetyltransferase [uncultured Umboniibacter sp.]